MNIKTALLCLAAFGAGSAFAHHSVAVNFDQSSEITIEGRLTVVAWRNPHSHLRLNVADAGGAEWLVEFGAINTMKRSGFQTDRFSGRGPDFRDRVAGTPGPYDVFSGSDTRGRNPARVRRRILRPGTLAARGTNPTAWGARPPRRRRLSAADASRLTALLAGQSQGPRSPPSARGAVTCLLRRSPGRLRPVPRRQSLRRRPGIRRARVQAWRRTRRSAARR